MPEPTTQKTADPLYLTPILTAEQYDRLFDLWRQLLDERQQMEERNDFGIDVASLQRFQLERDAIVTTLALSAGVPPRVWFPPETESDEERERELDAVRAIGNENGLAAQQLRDRAAKLERLLDPIRAQASAAGRHTSELDIVAWLVEQHLASEGVRELERAPYQSAREAFEQASEVRHV